VDRADLSRARTLALAAAVAAACTAGERAAGPAPAGLGQPVATGEVRAVAASPDGAWLAFLDRCREAKTPYLPPRTASCDLRLVPAAGGEARRVAAGVTTLPQGFGWAPEAAVLAALGGYDYSAGAGTLLLWEGGEAREVAQGVTFDGFLPRPAAAVAAVAGGRLVIATPRASRSILGIEDAATFEFDPAPGARPRGAIDALVRTRTSSGGALLGLLAGTDEVVPLARGVVDYGFAPRGGAWGAVALERNDHALLVGSGRTARRAGGGAQGFAFARDGSAIAWIGEVVPGGQGSLHVGRPGAAAPVVAREVGEYRWAAAAPRLAWLERYDPRVRAGTLGAGGPDLAPRTFAANVTDFDLSPDGTRVAYLQHTTRGGYSVDLGIARVDAPAAERPASVAQGVFGFAFSPDGRWLYYRTRCTRNAEACDLERVPAGGLPPGRTPEVIAPGVKSFEFDPRDPDRLLLGFQRMDLPALDVAVWSAGRRVAVDTAVVPGTARFVGPDSRRLAYAVMAPGREGVYVAQLP
jgi:hypothetical protein